MRISDWSSDVCSSDLVVALACRHAEIEGIDERPGGDLRVDVAGVAQEEAVTAYRCGHRHRVVDKAQFARRLEAGKAGLLQPQVPVVVVLADEGLRRQRLRRRTAGDRLLRSEEHTSEL